MIRTFVAIAMLVVVVAIAFLIGAALVNLARPYLDWLDHLTG